MKKCLLLYLLLLAALPEKEACAASPFLYMLGHAGWTHYLCNLLAWAATWHAVTLRRTLAAWAVAAAAWTVLPKTPPALGWSVIQYFYWGVLLTRRGVRGPVLTTAAVGFLVPGIAAWHHLTMLAAGLLYRKLEARWEKTE
jgi:hypothetical protein